MAKKSVYDGQKYTQTTMRLYGDNYRKLKSYCLDNDCSIIVAINELIAKNL